MCQKQAAPLAQILQTKSGADSTSELYGLGRIAALTGGQRTWYVADTLGSVRQTLSDSATPLTSVTYDPWGQVESGSAPAFGFTGELQDPTSGLLYLRARWYNPASSTFTSFRWRPDESFDTVPYPTTASPTASATRCGSPIRRASSSRMTVGTGSGSLVTSKTTPVR